MKKFDISVVEVRAFVGGLDDEPVVTPTHKVIAGGNSVGMAMGALERFLLKEGANITECDVDACYLKIDMPNLVLECEVSSDDKEGLTKLMRIIAKECA